MGVKPTRPQADGGSNRIIGSGLLEPDKTANAARRMPTFARFADPFLAQIQQFDPVENIRAGGGDRSRPT